MSQGTADFPDAGGILEFHIPNIKVWADLIVKQPYYIMQPCILYRR